MTYLLKQSRQPRAFWQKQHAEYHQLIAQTGYHWVSCQRGLHVCEYVWIWSLWKVVLWCFPAGFCPLKLWKTAICILWIMNKLQENGLPLFHLIEKVCESSCKQRTCRTKVLQISINKALCSYSHSINRNDTVCTLIMWVIQPLNLLLLRFEHICTLTHAHSHILKHTYSTQLQK